LALFTRLYMDARSTKHKTVRVLLFNLTRQLCYALVNVDRNMHRCCVQAFWESVSSRRGKKTLRTSNDIATAHEKDHLTDTWPFIQIMQYSNNILPNPSPLVAIPSRANKCSGPICIYRNGQTDISGRIKLPQPSIVKTYPLSVQPFKIQDLQQCSLETFKICNLEIPVYQVRLLSIKIFRNFRHYSCE